MDPGIDWAPAIAVLAVGLVVGGLLVWRMRARGPGGAAATPVPLELRDLYGQRDTLLLQIAELEDAAAKRSPEQLARERYALELETARVLMKIDALPAPATESLAQTASAPSAPARAIADPEGTGAAAPAAPVPEGAALRGFLWGIGSVAAVAGLVFLVTQAARPRDPGGSPTGDLPETMAARDSAGTGSEAPLATSGPATEEEARLAAAIERNPDDLDARIALAHAYLGRQEMMGVWTETQEVLARSPGHPRALSYQALVRLAMGQAEVALEMLRQAIATDPDLPDAYAPLGMILLRMGRTEEAEATMAEARRRFPDQAEAFERFQGRLLASMGEPPAPGEENPHASVAPPPTAPAAATPSSAPLGKAVGGRLDLDPSLGGQAGGVLFVIVRPAGVEAGPPLAVRRIVPTSFPLQFEVGEGDSMTGDPLPDEVLVDARLDSDGDPATRPDSDPRARVDHVRVGTADLQMVLKRAN